ncbi:MAG: hypothetical protein HWN80_12400 [Candidatus Lokiarchaeota archaeon]|nr:hypothetical protein [Candidatus Lokiarchaeota archaeon]
MKRHKINKKLTLLAIIGILLLSFIPFVAAGNGNGTVTKRPIEDWLDAQWNAVLPYNVKNWGMCDFLSLDSNLIAKTGFPFPFILSDEDSLVIGETTFGGHITERVLKDGRVLITVHLTVTNAPLTVFVFSEYVDYLWGEIPRPSAILGSYADGYIDYKMVFKFYIEAPGDVLPFCWDALEDYKSLNLVGTGYGILTDHAADLGFTPGAMGMLKYHQISLYKPDFKVDHPKYDPDYGDLWPIETVEIYELGNN